MEDERRVFWLLTSSSLISAVSLYVSTLSAAVTMYCKRNKCFLGYVFLPEVIVTWFYLSSSVL